MFLQYSTAFCVVFVSISYFTMSCLRTDSSYGLACCRSLPVATFLSELRRRQQRATTLLRMMPHALHYLEVSMCVYASGLCFEHCQFDLVICCTFKLLASDCGLASSHTLFSLLSSSAAS